MSRIDRRLTTLLSFLFALGSGSVGQGQTPSDDELIPPVAVYKVDPTHPADLYERGIEGEAIVVLSIDPLGSVVETIVEHATNEEFGLAAMIAASEWIFEPATKNGVPVAIRVRKPFHFKIAFEHKLNVEIGRAVFQKIDVPVVPSFELEHAPTPSYVPAFDSYYPDALLNTGKSASVSVEFIIDPEGNVINPRILSISNPDFKEAALRAASQMKYNTMRIEGQPVYVSLTMPIQFSP